MPRLRRLWLIAATTVVPVLAAGSAMPSDDLLGFSLEELTGLSITAVAKRPVALLETPAAATVLTGVELQAAPQYAIPTLIENVPGVFAQPINGRDWSVSIRGFNDFFANKLLVLIDGRSVYNSLFSGVFWDSQSVFWPDLEAIEVVRGPGGTIWGANAVNGVVSVVTKSAHDTLGGHAYASAGDESDLLGGWRYGWKTGERGAARVYLQAREPASFDRVDGAAPGDPAARVQVGFRADWELAAETHLTVQGDGYSLDGEQRVVDVVLAAPFADRTQPRPFAASGVNLIARLQGETAQGDAWDVQGFVDRYYRADYSAAITFTTLDLDTRVQLRPFNQHQLTIGVGGRLIFEDLKADETNFEVLTDQAYANTFSLFFQDEWRLAEQWTLTGGSKLEHNNQTGWEYQPSVRLLYAPQPEVRLWGAITRAVRTPSRIEAGLITRRMITFLTETTTPSVLLYQGSPTTHSERLWAFEAGAKGSINLAWSWEVTGFYNVYTDLIYAVPTGVTIEDIDGVPVTFVHTQAQNAVSNEAAGVETSLTWLPNEAWRFRLHYALFHNRYDLEGAPPASPSHPESLNNLSPEHHASLEARWSATPTLTLVTTLRSYSGTEFLTSRTDVSASLQWECAPGWTLTLAGQRLAGTQAPRAETLGSMSFFEEELPPQLSLRLNWGH